MAKIHILNENKNTELVITDRDDSFNEIQFYESGDLTKIYKCRLEKLSIQMLSDSLNEYFERNKLIEVGYPNFLFKTEKCGDKVSVKFIAYPSDYYTIELELGYMTDLKVTVNMY